MPADGIGKSDMSKRKYNNPKRPTTITRKISKPPGLWHLDYRNGKWVLVFNADSAKLGIQSCLRVEPGNPGALTLAHTHRRDRKLVSRHLTSEVYRDGEWHQSGQNHLLDCAGMAWIGGHFKGWVLKTPKPDKTKQPTKGQADWLTDMIKKRKAHARV